MDADAYNYEFFDRYVESGEDEEEFGSFMDRLHVGEAAPTGTLTDLATGEDVELADLWRRQHTVMEFGSFT